MKTRLDHLPEVKQKQIHEVAAIIKEVAVPEKIILFGSYATGNWVEDKYMEAGIMYEYLSDYDVLVVTKNSQEKEHIVADKVINRCRNLFRIPVNLIMHDIDYINQGLTTGQYFFSDIVKEGVLLFDNGQIEFAKPKNLTPSEQKQIAEDYFRTWFNSANDFLHMTKLALNEDKLKVGAFLAHQATERFYNTILLVFTGYKPKTHSLERLRQHLKLYSREVFYIFPDPTEDKELQHLFDLLKRGYIDARYKPEYSISKEELNKIIEKLECMRVVVDETCSRKINEIV